MPTTSHDLTSAADVIQEVITSLENAAKLLAEKQPGRHAERACKTIHFDVAQLQGVVPALRDLLRDPREPRTILPTSPDFIPASAHLDG